MAVATHAAAASPRSVAYVDPYLRVVILAGAGVIAAALVGVARDIRALAALTLGHWALLAGLMVASYLILSHLILFDWRGQRVALGPDEVLVFLALYALPPPVTVLFAVPTMALYQVRTKRPFLRAGANVAFVALAGGAGATSYILLSLALPKVAAVALAIVVYTLTTHLLVSSVFALREGTPARVVFGERFVLPSILHITLGVSGGVAIVALWTLHPLAVLVLAPVVFLARQHVELLGRREREDVVHRKLSEMTLRLAGERDLDALAERVVTTSLEIFQAGRATLVLSQDGRERRWTRDFEGGHKTDEPPLAASIVGAEGTVLGALLVHPSRRRNHPYGSVERDILTLVAGEAGAAITNVNALRETEAARARLEELLARAKAAEEALLSQRVARPLVRRIVRGLMAETRADPVVLLRLGEQLAAGLSERDLAVATRAYAEMGLGRLEPTSEGAGRYEFRGTELLEHTERSRATTCYLALGFLRGAVSRANGDAPSKGAETSCASRGDRECRFVVTARGG